MIADRNSNVKRFCGWLMIGIVGWHAVGIPWVLASEEVTTPPLLPTPLVSNTESATNPATENALPTPPSSAPGPEPSPSVLSTSPELAEEQVVETGAAEGESIAVTEVNTSILGNGQITVAVTTPAASSSALVLGEYQEETGSVATDSATNQESSAKTEVFEISNTASVSSQVIAEARSGEVVQQDSGEHEILSKTGDASALAVNVALVNTTLINSELWLGVVGVTEEWGGDIYIPITDLASYGLSSAIKLSIDNNGDVSTTTVAEAKTGGVSQNGGGTVETGGASALASSIVLADMTLIDTEVTAILVENLWLWSGEIYNLRGRGSVDSPQQVWLSQNREVVEDCNKTMSCGREIVINNQADVKLDTTAKADTGEVVQNKSEGATTQTGDAMAIANSTALVNTTLLNSRLRLLNLLLGAPWRGNLVFVYPEEVVDPTPEPTVNPDSQENGEEVRQEQGEATETPRLKLSATHNAENGIYPGDGVTYDVIVYNEGPITAHNVMLKQEFVGGDGSSISTMQAKIGEIGVNKRRVAHFVLKTGSGMKAGKYVTSTVASGESDQGAKTDSNWVVQEFKILMKSRVMAASGSESILPVEIVNIGDNVLGVSVSKACENCLAIPWYIAIWLGSLLYYGVCLKRKDWGGVMRWGLALPLSSYAGLLYTNPACRSGIEIIQTNNFWCDWFLAIAVGIYLINGLLVKIGKNISNTNVPAMIYFRS